jgi:hypothetical protein
MEIGYWFNVHLYEFDLESGTQQDADALFVDVRIV